MPPWIDRKQTHGQQFTKEDQWLDVLEAKKPEYSFAAQLAELSISVLGGFNDEKSMMMHRASDKGPRGNSHETKGTMDSWFKRIGLGMKFLS